MIEPRVMDLALEPTADTAWVLEAAGYDPLREGSVESRFAISNGFLGIRCQSAFKFDPGSASNFDPLERRVRAVALAPSELAGVAETARARVVV
jgi:hypothetical protein